MISTEDWFPLQNDQVYLHVFDEQGTSNLYIDKKEIHVILCQISVCGTKFLPISYL